MNIKKYSFLAAICLSTLAQAQQIAPSDIMRYNESDMNGTARFRGMSGAFGALGGDLSALKINPAGSAIFNYNTAAFSLSYNHKNNKTNYLGSTGKENYSGIDLGQMGAAFVFNSNNKDAVVRKFTIGLNYENTKSLRNDTYFQGYNSNANLGDYFFSAATKEHVPLSIVKGRYNNHVDNYIDARQYYGTNGQEAYLGYQSGIFIADDNGNYIKNYNNAGGAIQSRYNSTSGYIGKFSGNFGMQLGDRIYVGSNLNISAVDYTQNSSSREFLKNPTDDKPLQSIDFNNYLYTYGTGFSFNLGIIGNITDNFRAGLAYESPTWYNLKDETMQTIRTSFINDPQDVYVNPNVVNLFDSYKITTPSRYTGSLAYIFGKQGLLSVDYSIKDYTQNKFKPTSDPVYSYMNNILKSDMQAASELRIGGEYRIKQVSLRGGYRYEQSPYKTNKVVGDLNSFSMGLGFDFGGSRLDLSYTHAARDYQTSLLDLTNNDLFPNATNRMKENSINLTYNIHF
ncbi:MAG: outer membrane protein transport protein [Flavobacteriaceae bacterium]|jgi:hypothetical protein|nr:outer membrane protein transport protein [Flavobacteriaceae bacterium]